MNNPFVGFETFTKQHTDDEHPYGEDSHLDDDSILERHGDVETDDNYYEPDDYDEEDDVDLQWGKVSDAAKGAVGAAKTGVASAAKTAQTAGKAAVGAGMDAAQTAGTAIGAAGQKAAKTAQSAGQAAGATVGQAAQTAGGFAQDAASTGIAAGQQAARAGMDTAQAAGQTVGQAAKTAGGFAQDTGTMAAKTAQTAGQAAGAKVADLGQAAAQTAKTGAAKAGGFAQDAGAAAGQKVAGAFGKSHDDMMASLDQAIGFMEKRRHEVPEGWDEDDYWDAVTYRGLGAKEHEAYGDECHGEDCVIHGTPLYEREDPYPPQTDPHGPYSDKQIARNKRQAHDDAMYPTRATDDVIELMEKQIEKGNDKIMSNPFVGFDTFRKQVGEDDEPTGYEGVTAVRQASRRGTVEDSDVDPLEVSEDFEYTPELNESQISAIEEASRNRQQGIAENEVPEPRSQRIYNPEAAALKDEYDERKFQEEYGGWRESKRIPTSEKKKVQRNQEDRKRLEEERWARGPARSTRRYNEYLERHPDTRLSGQRVLTPENISTSARENRLDEEDRIRRAEQSRRVREQAVATRDKEIVPMRRPERAEASDIEDDFAQSADSVLAKALGSVIGIMEKQDPRFRCQECGAKVPKSSRKCRKCGSEDIDLG